MQLFFQRKLDMEEFIAVLLRNFSYILTNKNSQNVINAMQINITTTYLRINTTGI